MILLGGDYENRYPAAIIPPKRGKMKAYKQDFLIFLAPSLVIMGILLFYPLFYCFKMSFYEFHLLYPPPRFVGLKHFIDLFHDEIFLHALGVTAYITGITVCLEFLVGFATALFLNAGIKGRDFFLRLVLLPMMLPPVVVGLVMRWMFLRDWGMVNYFLSLVGIQGPAWLTDRPFNLLSIVFGESWQWTAFTILVLFSGLQSLPREPIEAARIDGASFLNILWSIIIPLLKPLIIFVLLIRCMDAFRIFDKVFVMTGGGPGISSETVTAYNYRLTFGLFRIGQGSALAVLTFLILSIGIGAFIYVQYRREKVKN